MKLDTMNMRPVFIFYISPLFQRSILPVNLYEKNAHTVGKN
jgi:hypothetical protein